MKISMNLDAELNFVLSSVKGYVLSNSNETEFIKYIPDEIYSIFKITAVKSALKLSSIVMEIIKGKINAA